MARIHLAEQLGRGEGVQLLNREKEAAEARAATAERARREADAASKRMHEEAWQNAVRAATAERARQEADAAGKRMQAEARQR